MREVALLDYPDRRLDSADPREAIARIVGQLRRHRPDVVVTFGHDGAYGHPDHVAISQFTTAAVMAASDAGFASEASTPQPPPFGFEALLHRLAPLDVERLPGGGSNLSVTVDGALRHATPWPDWAVTTVLDTSDVWPTVWRAVSCHESQLAAYEPLKELPPEHHRALWGRQSFYRAFSLVNGGRARETDLFEGLV